ncbi:hypothetical protein BH09BAC2_BH09BAC2_16040 [soil metagenome]
MNEMNSYWYAIIVRPRSEKKVAEKLLTKGIESYCPTQKKVSQWSDRKKIILEPVFKGYVFLNVPDQMKWKIKEVDGVLNYVYHSGKPAIIPEPEIIIIKKFLNEFSDVQVQSCDTLHINTKVRVANGLLMNYEGIVIEVSGNLAKVKVDSIGIVLTATFEKKNLEKITV